MEATYANIQLEKDIYENVFLVTQQLNPLVLKMGAIKWMISLRCNRRLTYSCQGCYILFA